MDKIDGHDWFNKIGELNPDGERMDLNPECKWHIYQRFLNNPMAYIGQPKYNPADDKHPLWFDWVMIGTRFS